MSNRTIVISDLHGGFDAFNRLLNKLSYNPHCDRLYLLGDYGDRGTQSKELIQYVRYLTKHFEFVKAIGGNHDDMFLAWLDDNDYVPNPYTSEKNGGLATILSFCPFFKMGENDDEVRAYIKDEFDLEIDFLRNLPSFIEDEKHIFVHAGINPELENWRDTTKHDFRWIRDRFIQVPNPHDKTIVFGHTQTNVMHQDKSNFHVWFGDKKIGIDGGLQFGGQLNALIIQDGKYDSVHVTN